MIMIQLLHYSFELSYVILSCITGYPILAFGKGEFYFVIFFSVLHQSVNCDRYPKVFPLLRTKLFQYSISPIITPIK